ncbi:Uncharacterised protein [Bordetella pertussis]|nr:Uncharacterised protein [Bordetella pertussis]CFW45022.1 Uncharacterised protein [Bordetella pertussis]
MYFLPAWWRAEIWRTILNTFSLASEPEFEKYTRLMPGIFETSCLANSAPGTLPALCAK